MTYTENQTDRRYDNPRRGGAWGWIVGLILATIVVIALFFAFGGDADVDVDGGDVDIEAPAVDADVEAPDVDVEAPDVDVDPGSVDVDPADAEADADADADG